MTVYAKCVNEFGCESAVSDETSNPFDDCCPDLTTAPANVTFTDSECQVGCTVISGEIFAPAEACPEGSYLEYSTDDGANWSTDLPEYSNTEAMIITTRCSCEIDSSLHSPASDAVTTNPGDCGIPSAPSISFNDYHCDTNPDGGSVTINGCSDGTIY